jgi:hypothetical protein
VWRCLVVPGFHNAGDGAAVPEMVAQRRGWPHRAGGDGGDVLHWSDVTALSRAGAGLTSVPLSRVPPPSFEGCDVEAIQEWVAQCHGVDTGLPHSSRTVSGMAAQGGLAEQRCRMDLPGPTTSVGTRTDYSVGPWDYSACATRHLMAWAQGLRWRSTRIGSCTSPILCRELPRRTRLVLSPQTNL